ncbi:MAG: glycosyltransferase family protein [Selenomonadaceae bacterium]|nr:glycosyltransferase family protein [Selenomonadaceae bacterium]
MYASFFKDVTVLPIGTDENLTGSIAENTGDSNRFWLEICRPHTPIVTALKAGEQYPGENAAITAYLRRREYDIEASDLAIDIGAIPTRRLALFIHSVIADKHKDRLLTKLSPFLPEKKLAALRHSLDELAEDDIPDFFDEFDEFEPETVAEIPAPIPDGKQHTIAFVTCVNDEARYAECCRYLKAIDMPRGWSAKLLPIRGAVSMAEGYETGRQMARAADIIVYLHQDVLVVNKNLVSNLIAIFSHSEKIGLVGVIGCRRLPETGIWWDGRRMVGQVLHACEPESIALAEHHEPAPDRFIQGVEAVDGLFIAARGSAFPNNGIKKSETSLNEKSLGIAFDGKLKCEASPSGELPEGRRGKSIYDIPWRADLFDGWHFYDSSICREYRRRGLSVVIPRQGKDFWCIHCPTEKPLDPAYHRYRQRFLREYGNELRPEV